MELSSNLSHHNCPTCNASLSDDFAHCPYCGTKQPLSTDMPTEQSQPKPKSNRTLLIVVAIVAGFFLLLLAVGGYFFVKYKNAEPEPMVAVSDSIGIEEPIDSSLLYDDDYKKYERSEKYTMDISSLYADDADTEEMTEDEGMPKSCQFTKEVNIEWPVALKGVKYIEQIQTVLLGRLSEKNYLTIDDYLKGYFKKPKLDDVAGPNEPYEKIEVERCDGPNSCIQFKITQEGDNGGGMGGSNYNFVSYVAYDKLRQKVLTYTDVFLSGTTPAVVAQINREILRLNKKKDEDYATLNALPLQFCVGRTGIKFVATEALQFGYQGTHLEVEVPYTSLMPYLGEDFLKMIENN